MKDVAKAAGVTTAAVSYAISGKRPISDETRKRVEQAIKELGYAPNMAARTLSSASRDSKLIGVVVPQTEGGGRLMFQNQFYSEILGSIELCARQKGYHVLISATDANESYLMLAKERNLDGIIVIGMYPDSFYQQMKKSQIPIVLIDSYCNDHYYHNIRIDDAYGSYLATRYVLDCGHRAVAFFSGRIKENGVMKKRLAGYRDALAEYEIPFREELIFEGNIDYKDGIVSAQRLMDAGLPATAVVAAADILAGKMPGTYKATVSFGEYGAPDFDSRVKTLSSAATGGIMSVQAQVDELWGSSKDDDWKAAEVRRILNERGIDELEEPSLGGDSLK